MEKKTTESTPMPNAEEQNQKSMEFSPIDTVEDTTGNTPGTIKDESQAKRTSLTERIAMMVEIKSREVVAEEQQAEKGKTFGTVPTITTEADQDDEQVKQGATVSNRATVDHETTTPLELGKARSDRQETKAQRRGSRGDKERIKIQQTRVPGQLLQSGEGDRGKTSADVREGRGH